MRIEFHGDETDRLDEIPINVATALIHNALLSDVNDIEEVANHLLAYVTCRRNHNIDKIASKKGEPYHG